ncbi:MAG: hypothetical protein MJ223_03510 [Mycoplasmoidaceae bacterium]|nr:hypothetical protein [Mycoplasmoidaceae bacterium]
MKKTLYLTPCISLAAIAPICSCGPSTTSAEAIANAIFGSTDITPTTLSTSFADALKSMSSEERKNELVYDLFNRFNQPIDSLDKTIKQLYVDNVVGINTNINTNFFSLEFNQDKLIANFLGSVFICLFK